jgi:Raf kinase inhibitor-like YbhB/YbcL family protein
MATSVINDLEQACTLKSNGLGKFTNKQYANGMGSSGENTPPQLYCENTPKEKQNFAVTLYDLDTLKGSGFWHWVAFNIPANVHELKSDAGDTSKHLLPEGAVKYKASLIWVLPAI